MQVSINEPTLKEMIQGTWWLLSRIDRTQEGERRIDPILGEDPVAILVYANDHFAAQFMKRDRSSETITQATAAGQNNTAAVGGYDAYFGTYTVDEHTGLVAHTLVGSINPANIGITVQRMLMVENEQLIIQLDTTATTGEPVIRTLTWKRVG